MSAMIYVLLVASTLVVIACVVMLFTNRLYYTIFSLLIVLIGVAIMFAALNAEFIAVVQLIIYIGGTLILLLFGTMLIAGKKETIRTRHYVSIILVLVFYTLPAQTIFKKYQPFVQRLQPVYDSSKSNIEEIGLLLAGDGMLSLELFGILLLLVLAGIGWFYQTANE
jgi:NADH-quinone oxidoreductase subunit J